MEKVKISDAEIVLGDCFEVMRQMPDNSIDAIITDPPYFKVKGEDWDNQWDKPAEFIAWVGKLVSEFERLLKPNGSLYFFASSKMAARVEVEISKRMNILNNITWRKGRDGLKTIVRGNQTEKEALRSFFPETEKIIFAEHYNSDNIAKGEAGYLAKCDELRGFVFEPLREYLAVERDLAGYTTRRVAEEYQKKSGSRTVTGMAGHWFESVQWALPTEENYAWLRNLFNANGGKYLRREYEDLRREYEDLRRPFNLTARDQWGDVWDFDSVQFYPGKHPCEKPLPLLMHMLKASTNTGSVVFDPFAGSGSMGHACHEMGRVFIGVESCPANFEKAKQRISHAHAQGRLAI